MSEPLLKLDRISAGYGDLTVLRDISLTVAAGEVLCISGRNGVGKTTLMRLISGALPPQSGTIAMNGQDIAPLEPHARQHIGLSYAPQDSVTFAPLTLRENLSLHHKDHSLDRYQGLFRRFPRIEERLGQVAGTLSGGERKILAFCRVMAEGGSLLCLDEPTEGVQPENITHMAEEIRAAAEAGRGLVVVEQNLSLIEQAADRVIVIDHGEIVHQTRNGPEMRAEILEKLKV
ncbi:ATP-binding cassette domain-containing protein [Sulfitobacter porphyrae]|uniref:ATP-binding cassette domain-containing protein n=1 Tax=Sulfitobacter porphyrae TaxID=1246864 RepID=A0ABW2BCE7_9RHOB|nr:ABC transporter ATP-binding protein [Sulfitobacter porphyrae]